MPWGTDLTLVCQQPAGKTLVFPAFLFVALMLCAVPLVNAAPPEEKFPESGKPQLDREPTVLEQAVDRAAVMLLNGKLPANEDGVRFALWLYGEKGDVAYRDIATRMARELVKTDPIMGSAGLFWVAQAGGPTLDEAKSVKVHLEGDHRGAWRKLSMITATRNAMGSTDLDSFLKNIGPPPTDAGNGGAGYGGQVSDFQSELFIQWLRLSAELAQFLANPYFSGDPDQVLADVDSCSVYRIKARAVLAAWEVGQLLGDIDLIARSMIVLESILDPAVQDTNATAIVGLAAGRMSRHPLHIAVVGDPADSLVTALRNAAYFAFEPNKVILNLDPAKDAKRMETMLYPAEAAPALFVCVETLCSPPVRDPAEIEKQVAEIKKLAAQIEQ